MVPIPDYQRTPPNDEAAAHFAPLRSSVCGGLSIAMFVTTLCLFWYAWETNSPQSKHYDESATMAMATMGTALIGLLLEIVGCVRKERNRGVSIAGIVLNGAWLACGGLVLAIGYVIFGGSRDSDWH